jgi:hypothetical protein
MKIAIASIALLSATLLQANVSITVVGTVNTDPTGTYTAGDPISMTFDVNLDPLAGLENSEFTAAYNRWGSETYSGGPLVWDNISSPQLGGTYSINANNTAPRENLQVYSANEGIDGYADSDIGSIGLTLGAENVDRIAFSLVLPDAQIDFNTGSLISTSDYLAAYAGSYGMETVNFFTIRTALGATKVDITDLTIVPEPTTSALFLGFLAAGLLIYRRRKLA